METIELYKRVFVASFTYDEEEAIPLWKMYTKKGLGIRMDFFFKTDSISSHFIDNARDIVDEYYNRLNYSDKESDSYVGQSVLKIKDIIYDNKAYDDKQVVLPAEDGLDVLVDNCGWYKSTLWKYERETRLVLSFHNGIKELNTDYILVPIDSTELSKIVIRYDPWMSDEMIFCIQLGLEEYAKQWGIDIDFRKSELHGKVR